MNLKVFDTNGSTNRFSRKLRRSDQMLPNPMKKVRLIPKKKTLKIVKVLKYINFNAECRRCRAEKK